MGVRQCDRRGCQSIMCDHYSYEYGYICVECRNELIESINPHSVPSFQSFMESEKDCRDDHYEQWWADRVMKEFPSQTNYDLGGDI